ncbi:MAG: hypothetical protein K2H09_10490 [Treponemataceae bacterium]|nr:hypothetical protein [Treponemataceae bacterium]
MNESRMFARRKEFRAWFDKNKSLAHSLEERGLMTDFGRQKRLTWRLRRCNAPTLV